MRLPYDVRRTISKLHGMIYRAEVGNGRCGGSRASEFHIRHAEWGHLAVISFRSSHMQKLG